MSRPPTYTQTPYLSCANQTNDPGHTTPGLTLLTYGYDLDGNMTSTTSGRSSCTATSGGTTSNYTYNNADQSTTGSAAFDDAGNQTETQSGTTLTYNALSQTTAIGSSDPLTYTGGGQDGLTGDTTATTLQNSSVLGVTAVTTSGSTVYFTRDPNGNLVSMRVGSSHYSYVLDPYKNVIGLLAVSGTSPAATYTYTPYGKQLTTLTGVGATNPFQYNSGYTTASGDIHFGARYYDPNIGRWTQLDPSGNNPGYVFAGNNPVNLSDPTGTNITIPVPWWLINIISSVGEAGDGIDNLPVSTTLQVALKALQSAGFSVGPALEVTAGEHGVLVIIPTFSVFGYNTPIPDGVPYLAPY
jgi:RHS repeat-associated protein